MDTNTLIGTIGALILLIGFVLLQMKFIGANTRVYNLISILGSSFLLFYAAILNSIPFIILNLTWVIVAGFYLIKSK